MTGHSRLGHSHAILHEDTIVVLGDGTVRTRKGWRYALGQASLALPPGAPPLAPQGR